MTPVFLIAAPDFTHRSAGVRALYRLCHHLNASGYPAAMVPMPGHELRTRCEWRAPRHDGPIGDAIVVYPEVVSGNPFGAQKVVRWALNNPGLLGGDTSYAGLVWREDLLWISYYSSHEGKTSIYLAKVSIGE